MPPPVKGSPPLTGALAALLRTPPPRALNCRRCSGRLHRSRARSRAERILWPWVGLKPFRCGACGWRGLRNPSFRQAWSFPVALRTVAVVMISIALGGVVVEKCIPQDTGPAPVSEE